MNPLRHKPPAPWPLSVLFIVITISVIVAGIIYNNNQKNNLLTEKQLELSVIANLKIRQITQWRLERLGDAAFMGDNNLILKNFLDYIKKPSDKNIKSDIILGLKSLTENFDYTKALIFDSHFNSRISYPEGDTLTGEHLKPLLPGVLKNREILFSDLHMS